jgi:hypothetical protein
MVMANKYNPTNLKVFDSQPHLVDGVDFVVTSFEVDDTQGGKRIKRKLPNYECAHCAFSSTEEHRIIEHLNNNIHPYGFGVDPEGNPHTKHVLLRDVSE